MRTMDYSEIFKSDIEGNVAVAESVRIKEPKRYGVCFFNDDYTTTDFVVEVLIKYYNKSEIEADTLMRRVHERGSALIGSYSYDIAKTLVHLTIDDARSKGFPLRCTLQEL